MIEVAAGIGAFVLAAMLAVALHDLIRRPAFRRLAVRNLVRRRTEAALVVLGSSLGTAIIAAAFLVGATFHASVRDGARTQLGPIDEQVTVARLGDLTSVVRALKNPPPAHTDGLLPTVQVNGSVVTGSGAARRAEPTVSVAAFDLSDARAFGGHVADTGLAGTPVRLDGGEALIGRRLADRLHLSAGGRFTLHAYGSDRRFTVAQVLEPIGLAGANDVIVSPGTIRRLAAGRGARNATPPKGIIFVSNTGRVFDSVGVSDQVARAIGARLDAHFDVDIESVKADLLTRAENRGRSMGELFTGVGTFSVLAGILLLVNLFVMLTEERKRELGLARATGLTRWHLVRILALEGAFYGLAAAFVGAFIGTGVAWVIARAAAQLGNDDATFHLRFVAPTGVLVTASLIGLGLSFATVWLTSVRLAKLNIVLALRDLPEVPRRRHELRSSGPAAIGIAAGVALAIWGVVAIVPLAAVLGPPIAFVCLIPLLRPTIGRRAATAVASVGTLVWCVGVFTFLTRITDHTGIPVYVIQGLVMVAAAVGLATALDRVWTFGLGLLTRTGKGIAGRIGLAYPLEKIFRTGLLVGMYALIVFTLTFLVVYARIISSQNATITSQLASGADLIVDANPSNPVSASDLASQPGVAGVARLWRAGPTFTAPGIGQPTRWAITGFEPSLLRWGTPHLTERAPAFSSDRAVFRAMLGDPHLIVVDAHFLDTSGVTDTGVGAIGISSMLTARDPVTGRSTNYRVVGITSEDLVGAGAWAGATGVRALAGTAAVPSRFYVRVTPGSDPQRVADALDSRLVSHGVDAATFSSKVADAMAVELGFFSLMRKYLSIGLIIGIFGLAVVMVRASRSRRRQIGMLRTIGFTADTVRRIFLVEASFVSFQGIATGIGLGLLVSYQMLSRTAALGGDPLPWQVPWATVGALAFIPFAASLAVALIPASQASSVDPAAVLRLAE